MIQGQNNSPTGRKHFLTPRGSRLLQQHPVLIPLALISGSIGMFIVSFSANLLFPVLVFIGIPADLVCLLIALVLGIVGMLAGIISMIENIDRVRLRAGIFPPAPEGDHKAPLSTIQPPLPLQASGQRWRGTSHNPDSQAGCKTEGA